MTKVAWHKPLHVWRKRCCLYPAPVALPHTRAFWLAIAIVAALTLLFSGYFICYLSAQQDAFITNAEDLGIMDQAIWNTVHGHLLQQTICNILNDTNCYSPQGISRFALHFEPILFPVSLLYFLWPSPKALQILQVLVVASGAFPTFWLARLRLRNEWASVAIALLYLLYPAQQNALTFDFHAVTFTAALLLFTLYFMYTRRTALLLLFAILSMACKEEIPLLIAFFGLWSMLFQYRWRSGLVLVLVALAWSSLSLFVMHHSSPTGNPLLASRYTYLGSNPLQVAQTFLLHPLHIFKAHVWEHAHATYLSTLLAPAGYLPLLAPWVLILALPSLALNLLSTDPSMYSGMFQYNAELVPILIFSTIEAIVLLIWLAQQCQTALSTNCPRLALGWRGWVLLIYILWSVIYVNYAHSTLPFAHNFRWPRMTMHTEIAQHVIAMIPPTASVSAQTRLVPHLSQRLSIYLFPYGDDQAEYILLDVTGDTYPYGNVRAYDGEVKKVLLSGHYGIVAAENGYLLLERGLPPPVAFPYPLSS
ncbi:MAG: DUF2079 domain-containing protein [Ktedonobacteraceae bacterium]